MITIKLRGKKRLYSSLVRIERNVARTTGEFLKHAAEWLRNDIRSHWSTRSPSGVGNSPAVVTGNLDSAIFVEQTGRTSGGQFATNDNAMTWFVRVDTARGINPDGRGGYSQALEYDLNRPFMQPAVDRLKSVYERLAKRYIKT